MKVSLINAPENPEKLIACAAKLCYSASSIDDLYSGITQEKAEDFVNMLSKIGHESPIEHANFTFGVEGVSRSLLAQITRHRMASFSVQSQRYVMETDFSFVTPPEINEISQAKEVFLEAMKQDIDNYNKLADILKEKHKKSLVQNGLDEKIAERQAEKQAIEDARYVLPNACTTKMVLTMNARSLHNFLRLRCCNRAQWEIRDLAWEMLKILLSIAPTLFANAGPPCASGVCGEGKMSCKKQKEIKEKMDKLKSGLGE